MRLADSIAVQSQAAAALPTATVSRPLYDGGRGYVVRVQMPGQYPVEVARASELKKLLRVKA